MLTTKTRQVQVACDIFNNRKVINTHVDRYFGIVHASGTEGFLGKVLVLVRL